MILRVSFSTLGYDQADTVPKTKNSDSAGFDWHGKAGEMTSLNKK